jgi:DNA-binding GntR family transcriptional regulator
VVTQSKADAAYEELERLITFRHLPPGEIVTEAQLGDRVGVGRTPVREALQRLAREGMVQMLPRKGVVIPPVSVEQQLKLIEVRRPLEELAVRLAATRRTPDQQAEMAELSGALASFDTSLGAEAFGDLLAQSHHLMARAVGNEHLTVAIGPSQSLSRRFWFATMRDVEAELRRGADHHSDVLAAIAEGDEEAAAEASGDLLDYLTEFSVASIAPHRPPRRRAGDG